MTLENLKIVCQIIVSLFAIGGSIITAVITVARWKLASRAKKLTLLNDACALVPTFSTDEIKQALRYYVVPDCGQIDPSSETDFRKVIATREAVFRAIDRLLDVANNDRHYLVLADSGMGKTTLCINYYNRLHRKGTRVALVSLARSEADVQIRQVSAQKETVLILDALDEDPKAQEDVSRRLNDIFEIAANYKNVIITCRSQFFRDANSVPSDTGVTIVGPRRGGVGRTHPLYHLFLMPFTDPQIKDYLNGRFPLYYPINWFNRSKAFELIRRVPELAARPMLLDLVPDLVKDQTAAQELFDLYQYLVDKWLQRESTWIPEANLMAISCELAVRMHHKAHLGDGDRITPLELKQIADSIMFDDDSFRHLSTRSLLNRDQAGLMKFAHRSIMEFLFVKAAIAGDKRCLELPWTDVMRDIFVSWGYTNDGRKNVDTAKCLLAYDLSRTQLIPLSEPPSEPSIVSSTDIARAAARRGKRSGVRRLASKDWRADSVKHQKRVDGERLTDIENDLEWYLPESVSDAASVAIDYSRMTIAQFQRQDRGFIDDRLPSVEEFLTLAEALEATQRINTFPWRELYLLGDDYADKGRHIVAQIYFDQPEFHSLPVIAKFDVVGSKWKIVLYEVSKTENPHALQSLIVASLYVRRIPKEFRDPVQPTLLRGKLLT